MYDTLKKIQAAEFKKPLLIEKSLREYKTSFRESKPTVTIEESAKRYKEAAERLKKDI